VVKWRLLYDTADVRISCYRSECKVLAFKQCTLRVSVLKATAGWQ